MMASGGLTGLNGREIWFLALFGIGAVIMRGAGCIINDLWDRKLDQQVTRTAMRPLAAGTVTTRDALIFLFVLLFIGLLILLQMGLTAILLGILSLGFVIAYPAMKRITWWPQAFLGLTFNFGALIGWAAVMDTVQLPAVLLYTGGLFWTLGYDTIYAHQDIEDDMRVGIKSTALRLGTKSRIWVARFYAVAFLIFLSALIMAGAGWISIMMMVAAGGHLIWQVRTWDASDPASSLRIFKSNRDFGLIVLAATIFLV